MHPKFRFSFLPQLDICKEAFPLAGRKRWGMPKIQHWTRIVAMGRPELRNEAEGGYVQRHGIVTFLSRINWIRFALQDSLRGLLITHAPLGLELVLHSNLCEDSVAWQPADSSGTVSNCAELDCGDTASVTADRAGIALLSLSTNLRGERSPGP